MNTLLHLADVSALRTFKIGDCDVQLVVCIVNAVPSPNSSTNNGVSVDNEFTRT